MKFADAYLKLREVADRALWHKSALGCPVTFVDFPYPMAFLYYQLSDNSGLAQKASDPNGSVSEGQK